MHQGRIVQAARPIEVYRDPANRFVGSFIGNPPMNFLPARRENGQWEVAGTPLAGPGIDRQNLEFGIRPEDLVPAESGLTGAVKVVEPLGAHQLVTMDVGGHLFRAVLESDLRIDPGERLALAPKPDRVRWFDPDSGQALH
jgi:multiple sugar transport system ATP-binding protein